MGTYQRWCQWNKGVGWENREMYFGTPTWHTFSKYSMWECNNILPLHPHSLISVAPPIIYLFSLNIFSKTWMVDVKACLWITCDCFVSAYKELRNYGYKQSNLFKYLTDKYGEESVGLLRFCEFIVKKMVDYRNQRRFMLRCIKVRVTWPVVELGTPYMLKQKK